VDTDDAAHQELVDKILDQAGSKGTGKWTSQDAMNIPVPIPTIDMAVALRELSVYKELRVKAATIYQGGTSKVNIDEAALGSALAFSFVIAYAQGLSLLTEASKAYAMNIPMPSVVQVWKAGCIIRSGLLPLFEKAYKDDPQLPNLLLHPEVAGWLSARAGAARAVLCSAVQAGIPAAALGSAVAYFDAFRSDRLPTNLIQAQRDYFGAHTYRRIDREGVFHTEWNQDATENNNPVT
jgi:6-phosphogluconate dehydrogenase